MQSTATEVKERPIIFSAESVRAILSGAKTQTRRVVKPQPPPMFSVGDVAAITNGSQWAFSRSYSPGRGVAFPADPEPGLLCPYGQPGDRLWVREAWQDYCPIWHGYWCGHSQQDDIEQEHRPVYRADDEDKWDRPANEDGKMMRPANWRSPLFMPRWASRITLEIAGVRVERLQDIGKDGRKAHDVLAEGITREQIDHLQKFFHADDSPALAFAAVWDKLNGKAHPWKSNPWTWVVEFKRIELEQVKR